MSTRRWMKTAAAAVAAATTTTATATPIVLQHVASDLRNLKTSTLMKRAVSLDYSGCRGRIDKIS